MTTTLRHDLQGRKPVPPRTSAPPHTRHHTLTPILAAVFRATCRRLRLPIITTPTLLLPTPPPPPRPILWKSCCVSNWNENWKGRGTRTNNWPKWRGNTTTNNHPSPSDMFRPCEHDSHPRRPYHHEAVSRKIPLYWIEEETKTTKQPTKQPALGYDIF